MWKRPSWVQFGTVKQRGWRRKKNVCLSKERHTICECCACGWTCSVGLWVVWCHHSHMQLVSAFMLHGPASVSVRVHVHFPYLLILWSTVTTLGECFQAPFFLSTPQEKIAVQTTDVCSYPRPPLPFLRNGMFPTPWHNLTKQRYSWKNTGGLLFGNELSDFFHVLLLCWWELPIANPSSGIGALTFWGQQW